MIKAVEVRLRGGPLLEELLGALLVFPKARLGAQVIKLGEALTVMRLVKDTSRALVCAHTRRGAATADDAPVQLMSR